MYVFMGHLGVAKLNATTGALVGQVVSASQIQGQTGSYRGATRAGVGTSAAYYVALQVVGDTLVIPIQTGTLAYTTTSLGLLARYATTVM